MDHTFDEESTTEDVYLAAVQQLVPFVCSGGRGTVFAYGQTGSGKTVRRALVCLLHLVCLFVSVSVSVSVSSRHELTQHALAPIPSYSTPWLASRPRWWRT